MNQAAPRRAYRVPADHPASLLLRIVMVAAVIAVAIVGVLCVNKVTDFRAAVGFIATAVALGIMVIL